MARGRASDDDAAPLGWWVEIMSTSSSWGSGSMLEARRFRGEEDRWKSPSPDMIDRWGYLMGDGLPAGVGRGREMPDSGPDASPPLSLSMETSARAAAQGEEAVDDVLSAVDTSDEWVCSLGGRLDAEDAESRGFAERADQLVLLLRSSAVKESVATSSSASHDGRIESTPVAVVRCAVS
jgi:hypothetical protein